MGIRLAGTAGAIRLYFEKGGLTDMDNYSDYLSGKDCDTDSLRRARLEKAISEDEF